MDKRYPAKILLFGEYSVLNGSKALVIPYHRYKGEFISSEQQTETSLNSNGIIQTLIEYLEENGMSGLLDINSLKNAVKKGLFFKSDIPANYGLGSSGALTAAIFDQFSKMKEKIFSLEEMKKHLSKIESFFHGNSSGIDPLCSLVDKPLVIDTESIQISNIDLSKYAGLTTFIVDTKHHGKTKELVTLFNNMCAKKEYCTDILKEYVPVVNECIDLFVKKSIKSVLKTIFRLSVIQLKLFRSMIPSNFISLWEQGIETKTFSLKLCGSGGGGYLIGFTDDWEKTKEILQKNKLEYSILK